MINGAHIAIHTNDAAADCGFFRDVLNYPYVDAGNGWFIFKSPPSEIAMHPSDTSSHELLLMCDDIHATVAELTAKGVRFTEPVNDEGWGLITMLRLPGGGEVRLYEPRHERAHCL
ncbi:glyoxalase/bleomycin resistance protein/dioxygenase superfamily protein [Stackebrandtia albiflava]|uniref:Glyoxalase/bleomycin resistance protein/dioxygenase superfamily protein n=1 Tax=Stackebrandtia albiflava TaxID=406432 RepID=A0A562UYS3_9ACTN|nr:VOC family protein [Stackebrandtia albiflava]TWJ10766.1 glyoxalase/bleomycin resistance protein/dioxygenase superfamily protein [Stackebrandtia albiflava]